MTEFQLLDEPWIPVQDSTGEIIEVGLLEAFNKAGHWIRIVHDSPLVTISLYRLLFAIYQKAVSMHPNDERSEIWDAGGRHLEVAGYLEKWRHRFNLLDDSAPFWQVPDMTTEHGAMSWAKMAADLNDNNNKVLFDHTTSASVGGTDLACAARLLVACQMMSVGAGKSALGYNVNADLATKLVAIPEADCLAETLIINLLPDDPEDKPIWEQEVRTVAEILQANDRKLTFNWFGPASKTTWLTRSIRIMPPDEDGLVRTIAFATGIKPVVDANYRDPWVAHRVNKKGDLVPQRLKPTSSIWRELHATLVQADEDGWSTPAIVRSLSDFGPYEVERKAPVSWTVLVGGQAADKAKILGWGQERWRVPQQVLLNSQSRGFEVKSYMRTADDVAGKLERISETLASHLIADTGKADRTQARALAQRLPAEDAFWAALERPFAHALEVLGEPGDQAVDKGRHLWFGAMSTALKAAGDATHQYIGRGTGAIKAWAKVQPRLNGLIRKYEEDSRSYREVAS